MFLYGLSPANQYFTSHSNRHQDTFRTPFSCLHHGRIRWEKSSHLVICIISPNDLRHFTWWNDGDYTAICVKSLNKMGQIMDWYSWNDKSSPCIFCHSSILLTIAYHAICFMMRLRFVHLSCRNVINYVYICSYNNRKRWEIHYAYSASEKTNDGLLWSSFSIWLA